MFFSLFQPLFSQALSGLVTAYLNPFKGVIGIRKHPDFLRDVEASKSTRTNLVVMIIMKKGF